jgi:hypothetical protein
MSSEGGTNMSIIGIIDRRKTMRARDCEEFSEAVPPDSFMTGHQERRLGTAQKEI